jgi:hypothetical protein
MLQKTWMIVGHRIVRTVLELQMNCEGAAAVVPLGSAWQQLVSRMVHVNPWGELGEDNEQSI